MQIRKHAHLCMPTAPGLMCCWLQVGASNELPESEELDALYDRFLIRRSVAQVSSSQLGNLARLAAGSRLVAEPASHGAGSNGAATPSADPEAGPGLDLQDFRSVRLQEAWQL